MTRNSFTGPLMLSVLIAVMFGIILPEVPSIIHGNGFDTTTLLDFWRHFWWTFRDIASS